MYQRYKFNNKWKVTGAWTSPFLDRSRRLSKNPVKMRRHLEMDHEGHFERLFPKCVSNWRCVVSIFSFLTKLFTLFTEVRTLGSTYTHIWTREDDEIYTRQFKHWLRPWRRPKWKSPLAWRAADKINCSTTLTNTYLDLTATGADCDAANGLIRFAIVVA